MSYEYCPSDNLSVSTLDIDFVPSIVEFPNPDLTCKHFHVTFAIPYSYACTGLHFFLDDPIFYG